MTATGSPLPPATAGLIAVTGATGHVGGLVAHDLAREGARLRLVVRSAARAPQLPGATVVETTYGDHDRSVAALAGVDVLLMVSAAESADRLDQHRTFIDAAVAAGVHHVVYTSFLGAAPDATFTLARDHWATEEHLRAAGVPHTILRDSCYLDFLPDLAGPDGVIRGPADDGVVGAVARADVARVAAGILLAADEHAGATYELTGSEALTLTEAAQIITEVTGRATTYVPETIEEAYASRASYGAPDWQVDAWVSTYTAIAAGELALVTDTVERLTGRRSMTLRELLAPLAL
ncbi:NAD(P)-dependent oxidoreductase [Cellulomonas sp. WB94]|uniref:SDR family oxidoreductase n=1 Tax=Cellulomonas sp. WB94 TaxID=2173174 RepID=UPI000D56CAC6|nr:SDR family oxidoreductase [Cellulomonas sp. WB94]PVU82729.1 NAD(P)-dependent oxidoreductase [Cellulomonas sp. WB94]